MDRYVTFVDRVASNPNHYTRTVNSNSTVSLTLNDSPTKTGTQINATLVNGLQDHFYNQYLTDKNSLVETFTSFGYSATTDTTFAQFIEWAKEISYFDIGGKTTPLAGNLKLVPVTLSYTTALGTISSFSAKYAEAQTLDGRVAYIWGGTDLKSNAQYLMKYDTSDYTFTQLSSGSAMSSYMHTYRYQPHSCVKNGLIIYVYGTRIFTFDGETWTTLTTNWGSSCINYGGVCECDVNNRIYISETTSTGALSTYYQIYAVDLDDLTATNCVTAYTDSSANYTPMIVINGLLYWIDDSYYLSSYDFDTDTQDSLDYNSSRYITGVRFMKILGTNLFLLSANAYEFDTENYVSDSIASRIDTASPTGYNRNPVCCLNGQLYNFEPYAESSSYHAPWVSLMKYYLTEE